MGHHCNLESEVTRSTTMNGSSRFWAIWQCFDYSAIKLPPPSKTSSSSDVSRHDYGDLGRHHAVKVLMLIPILTPYSPCLPAFSLSLSLSLKQLAVETDLLEFCDERGFSLLMGTVLVLLCQGRLVGESVWVTQRCL